MEGKPTNFVRDSVYLIIENIQATLTKNKHKLIKESLIEAPLIKEIFLKECNQH